ncbi:hypothetical protein GGTG_01565 [Gaeumannomyces tritici R3-111a-1]|uniref:Uncharacterized protein n=1 Tax=Gaeumannomyces tritici (strain R3-111a-1) TaxID=644352 RepID=J3NJY3_GAET3|nr:hypothetical protein GGTG_01565 [Gaeumannomyces tritici R3-111a-1]EJT81587.1 hypothetical protein GGTG_01565 [Gaeumannomyces tritici R3-111a-1]
MAAQRQMGGERPKWRRGDRLPEVPVRGVPEWLRPGSRWMGAEEGRGRLHTSGLERIGAQDQGAEHNIDGVWYSWSQRTQPLPFLLGPLDRQGSLGSLPWTPALFFRRDVTPPTKPDAGVPRAAPNLLQNGSSEPVAEAADGPRGVMRIPRTHARRGKRPPRDRPRP